MYEFCYIFLLFLIYAFLGYLVEVAFCSLWAKKLVLNRGFFLGPYLPIYGVSCLLIGSVVLKYKSDFFTVFVLSAFIATTVEYITSYVLEKIFKARWWDYTDRKFNIEGRVCLFNASLFGIGGLVYTYFFDPLVTGLLNKMSHLMLIIVSLSLLVIFSVDVIITVVTLCQVKISSLKFKNRDITAEITQIIRMELNRKRKVKNNFFIRHMLNAFPKIDTTNISTPLSRLKKYNTKKTQKKKR